MKAKTLISLLVITMFLFTACAGFRSKPNEVDYRFAYEVLGDTLKNIERKIEIVCPVLDSEECEKINRYYELSYAIYIIGEYYLQAIEDPDNTLKYYQEAVRKSFFLKERFKYYEDMAQIIEGIIAITLVDKEEKPSEKYQRITRALNYQIIDGVLNIIIQNIIEKHKKEASE